MVIPDHGKVRNRSMCDKVKLTSEILVPIPIEPQKQIEEPIKEPVKKDSAALGTLLLGGAAFLGAMLSQSAKAQIQGVRVASDIEPDLLETEVEIEVAHAD